MLFSQGGGKKEKGRNTLLSSKKITAEEMSAAARVPSLESNSRASTGKHALCILAGLVDRLEFLLHAVCW